MLINNHQLYNQQQQHQLYNQQQHQKIFILNQLDKYTLVILSSNDNSTPLSYLEDSASNMDHFNIDQSLAGESEFLQFNQDTTNIFDNWSNIDLTNRKSLASTRQFMLPDGKIVHLFIKIDKKKKKKKIFIFYDFYYDYFYNEVYVFQLLVH